MKKWVTLLRVSSHLFLKLIRKVSVPEKYLSSNCFLRVYSFCFSSKKYYIVLFFFFVDFYSLAVASHFSEAQSELELLLIFIVRKLS